MVRTTVIASAFAIAALLGANGAWADNVVKAEFVDWPPFTSASVDHGGIVVAITAAALKKAGLELSTTALPWARVLSDVKQGSADAAICQWYSEEHAKENILSDAVVDNNVVFVKKAGDAWDYKGFDSLNGKKVAIVKGYSYDAAFDKATSFGKDDAATLVGNLKKVAAGRDDLTVEDQIVAKYTIGKDAPELADKLAFAPTALAKNTCHVAFSRATGRGEELVKKFNDGLKSIKADGTYDAILKSFHAD